MDANTDWVPFKSAIKSLFGKNEGSGSLQERLFAVFQRRDEPASHFGSRVLDLVMKNFPLLSFKDQQQVALGHHRDFSTEAAGGEIPPLARVFPPLESAVAIIEPNQ